MTWPEPVERVAAVLRGAAVDARIEEFEDGTPTARDAARAVGCDVSQIVKSIVLVCDGVYVLALVPGDRRADERVIARELAATEVRAARPDEVLEATGFEPGGVAPFPHRAVTQTLIERSLLRHRVVWIGAGTDSHLAAIPPIELARLAKARPFELGSGG
ncbi:MAG TPA: YbaK/EbsC family protein [Gaiellaceae bacterium]|jgi:prolyl-tRNA editing enzyme YbaK/EbsC (Cys-tRNA(Pro) deacylase)|nr:YbaK/EbsC family protein [Gaiellaceae bacterium]